LRVEGVWMDLQAERFVDDAAARGAIRIIANRPDRGTKEEYDAKVAEARESHHLDPSERILFLEVQLSDASDFRERLGVRGFSIGGHRVLAWTCFAVPNAIAALLLAIRDRTGRIPHAYFGWTEGSP